MEGLNQRIVGLAKLMTLTTPVDTVLYGTSGLSCDAPARGSMPLIRRASVLYYIDSAFPNTDAPVLGNLNCAVSLTDHRRQ